MITFVEKKEESSVIEHPLAGLTALSPHCYSDRARGAGHSFNSGLFFLHTDSQINKSLENRWVFFLKYLAISRTSWGVSLLSSL